MNHTSLLVSAAVAVLPSLALAQGPADGLRMYAPHGTNDTFMVDNNGTIVQTWSGAANAPGNGAYLDANGNLVRTHQVAGAPMIGGRGGGVEKFALDGTLLWAYQYASATGWAHHDIALMPNGHVLMIVWDRLTANDAIAAGRDPALLATTNWLPDAIIEVEPTGPTSGNIVWEWHLMDHVIQDFDSSLPNFGVVADHPELLNINYPPDVLNNGEWNHCNSIDYDPVRDLIVLNSPFQDEFWLIDHSTTTAEAAGHTGGNFGVGGDFVYRWGNPAAYNRGTAIDQTLFFQHGTSFIPQGRPGAGNLIVFNNRAGTPLGMNYSSVVEIQLPATFSLPPGQTYGPNGFVWEYTDPIPTNMYSGGTSSAERLPNGNTLVCVGRMVWLFEVTPAGQRVWEYFPQNAPSGIVFQVSYVEQSLWSDVQSLSVATGGTSTFDIIAGSARANATYLVLGSAAGTTPGIVLDGLNLPLNVDGYFLSTLSSPNIAPFGNTVGTLDANGRATATFTLPPLPPAAAGIHLDHAFVLLNNSMSPVVHTSNAVPLDWLQ